ncbi:hypothetical protein DSCO28_55160 [Desulfosarcina ovata subsp. sediminis]|uniref:Tyr recombinase domain-containing protein n=1 Tax=Desulfosarcina ovata subsp. sediminis TaxID=885957 RepID=A0A5K7ZXX3_9BACT|nr:hypothetical protein DSCO28_55160 [Desulfosarcina ovata subsp. sediminis]
MRWEIIEKGTIDEIIFRTIKNRNRLLLELMARGGMRVGEVLKLRLKDLQDQKLILENPKSGKEQKSKRPSSFRRRWPNDSVIMPTKYAKIPKTVYFPFPTKRHG